MSPNPKRKVETQQPRRVMMSVSTSSRQNQYSVEVAPRVFAYHRADKSLWTLEMCSDAEVLILSDSNLKSVEKLPRRWELHSYAGARAHHVVSILREAKLGRSVRVMVIHIGITHKDDDGLAREELDEMIAALEKLGVRAMCMGVSLSERMDAITKDRIGHLNAFLRGRLKTDFIFPLRSDAVHIDPRDKYGIHYTPSTAARIIDCIMSRLLVKHLITPGQDAQYDSFHRSDAEHSRRQSPGQRRAMMRPDEPEFY